MNNQQNLNFDKIVEALERPGPRYTSYPTAPVWTQEVTSEEFKIALEREIQPSSALSLYVHLPFCEKLCHFCACHKIIDPRREHEQSYIDAIHAEVELYKTTVGQNGVLEQVHFGGGTPTFYSPADLEKLFSNIESKFKWASHPEISIEVNPVVTTHDHLNKLRSLGFNRLSLGVQDFEPHVQDIINRHQTFDQTSELVEHAKSLKFESINLDLVYGLPLQTNESIERTIELVIKIKPDRIALYSFANVPWKYPFQRRFSDRDIPEGIVKINLYKIARTRLLEAGYEPIGMDHFALPDDELFKARRNKKLHRNFMGYTTKENAQMVALGISAISMLGSTYVQNKKTLPSYYANLKEKKFPVERGIKLNRDDLIRRKVIMDLMCQFEVSFSDVTKIFEIDFRQYFRTEIDRLKFFETNDLLQLHDDKIVISKTGELLIRNIAMVFDRYLEGLPERFLFSKTI